jgi:hypothetical protein
VHQDLVLGRAGQHLFLDPPGGRPTGSATVVVESWQGVAQAATTGACTIDPASAPLADVASIGARSLALATTAHITPGSRYQLVGPDDLREWVVVLAVEGSRVAIRRPLVNRFEAGAVLGCRLSIAVDDVWASTVANLTDHLDVPAGYHVRWTYELAGVATSTTSTADLVRIPPSARISAADVDSRFPGWIAKLPSAYRESRGAELIAEAIELVNRDVRAHPEIRRARDAAMLRELAIIRANFVELEHQALFDHAPSAALRAVEERYQARFDELLQQAKTPRRSAATPRTSDEVVSVIDALMAWLAVHPLDTGTNLRMLVETWIPRLETTEERTAAAQLVRASVTSERKRLRCWRDHIIRRLLSE